MSIQEQIRIISKGAAEVIETKELEVKLLKVKSLFLIVLKPVDNM